MFNMRRIFPGCLVLLILFGTVAAQDTYYSFFSYNGFTPKVGVNDRSTALQSSLYPQMYRQQAVRGDMRWLAQNDSSLVTFWEAQGDTVLHIMRELSGIEWYESEFDVYLVRYFPTLGSSDPMILPIGGMGDGTVFEVAPDGSRLILNLMFQLSRRMLAQAVQPEDSVILGIAYHPLMQPGPYRQDNLAMLLAMATCQNIIGYDSTYDAYQSAFWKYHSLGRDIFEKYFLDQWILSPDRPLADWIAAEPYGSQLVKLTRPPKPVRRGPGPKQRQFVEGLPLEGELGFSVKLDESSRLMVSQIDTYRLAYANGLREGDRIFRVDGRRVKTQKAMVEHILNGLDNGGAILEIIREGNTETLLLQPIKTLDEIDYYYLDASDEMDADSVAPPVNPLDEDEF